MSRNEYPKQTALKQTMLSREAHLARSGLREASQDRSGGYLGDPTGRMSSIEPTYETVGITMRSGTHRKIMVKWMCQCTDNMLHVGIRRTCITIRVRAVKKTSRKQLVFKSVYIKYVLFM